MSSGEVPGGATKCNDAGAAASVPPTRFYALDSVRATAMLLGVFYHLPIAFMGGGFGMGFGFGASPKTSIDNWLHSFRMPLFFLISGFFASMMLGKYGLKRYLARRWWRIGAPLVIALFVLAGVRIATNYFRTTDPAPFGAPAGPFPGFGPAPGGFGATPPPPAGGAEGQGGAAATSPFGGFGPGPSPFGGFGAAPGVPGPAPFGGPAGGVGGAGPAPRVGAPKAAALPGTSPDPGPTGGFGGPGPSPFGGPNPTFGPPMELPKPPSRKWADWLFGAYTQNFNLEHLWFLWYLLIFVTIGPFVTAACGRVFSRSSPAAIDGLGRGLIRFNVMALVLGLVSLPALVHARGFMGWSLANPIGFLGPFPDFLVQYYADEPFYLLYFLTGWWLYRLRSGLSNLARTWLWNLVLGVAGFAASQALSDNYAARADLLGYEWIRLGGFALYGVGTAYSACGFLGLFQRFLDRPTFLGRYFADTALWIYLVHLPLIPYLIWWIEPWRTAWWGATLAGMVIVTGVTLVLFELLVRPTPLVYVFGPPTPRRPVPGSAERVAADRALLRT